MSSFVITLIVLILITVFIQLAKNMKIVGGNELGIKSGVGGEKGFTMITGGRLFIIPLIHKFSKIDLTPTTIEVIVDSAIAEGIVPLNVKATVSFAVASNMAGRRRAATRIMEMTRHWDQLRKVASDIIEGHLRDAIATMTPEQVMQDKDTLVSRMINVCKSDLENIGLEITTMNIADVDDHRLAGVDEPDLYIALLKRIQTTNAETKARKARAEANAKSQEATNKRRAEVKVRQLENEYEELVAQTRLHIREEQQKQKIGIEEATRTAAAEAAGLRAQINAEKERIEMLKKRYAAEIITPAETERDRMILQARQEAARIVGKAQGEIDELQQTIQILQQGGENGIKAYLIENFHEIMAPFAQTLNNFPVKHLSVISGANHSSGPISAIHPNAVDEARNKAIAGAFLEQASKTVND
ncbi:MAG: SPFH domain-containing protein [Bernardetiaceae bacterium]